MVATQYLESTPGVAGGEAPSTLAYPEARSLIGQKVSHYRVLDVIGGGGMGMVYRAEDLKLGRSVALKFLPQELTSDAVALQRFEREAQAASSLNHPNICTIHAIEEHKGQPFIVMELLEGETLRSRMAALEPKALPFHELSEIASQVCSGLEAAHQRGIIHRDIKPANIFLCKSGVAKILDFGLAKLAGDVALEKGEAASATAVSSADHLKRDLTRTDTTAGTAGYMSPEQVRHEELDTRQICSRSDWYFTKWRPGSVPSPAQLSLTFTRPYCTRPQCQPGSAIRCCLVDSTRFWQRRSRKTARSATNRLPH